MMETDDEQKDNETKSPDKMTVDSKKGHLQSLPAVVKIETNSQHRHFYIYYLKPQR